VAGRLRRKPKHGERLVRVTALDQLDHPAHLGRRVPDEASPRDSRGQFLCLGNRVITRVHRCFPFSVRAQRRRDLRSSLTWPLKVRVGANSPNLCPTIASVMNTGTCLRPSCTAMVWPSMSGMIVDRRDQVLMTVFLPDSLSASTFLSRWSSTNGPFFRLRGICGYLPTQRFLPVRLRRTINLSLGLRRRVRPSGLPFGFTG